MTKHTEPLRALLAAYRQAVRLHDPNTDDAFTSKAHNAILQLDAMQRAVNRAVADLGNLNGHLTADTISLLRRAASPVAAFAAPPDVRLVSIETGED